MKNNYNLWPIYNEKTLNYNCKIFLKQTKRKKYWRQNLNVPLNIYHATVLMPLTPFASQPTRTEFGCLVMLVTKEYKNYLKE